MDIVSKKRLQSQVWNWKPCIIFSKKKKNERLTTSRRKAKGAVYVGKSSRQKLLISSKYCVEKMLKGHRAISFGYISNSEFPEVETNIKRSKCCGRPDKVFWKSSEKEATSNKRGKDDAIFLDKNASLLLTRQSRCPIQTNTSTKKCDPYSVDNSQKKAHFKVQIEIMQLLIERQYLRSKWNKSSTSLHTLCN